MKKAPFASVIFIKRKYVLFAVFFAFTSIITAMLCQKVGNIPVSPDALRTIISGNSFVHFSDGSAITYYTPFFRQVSEKNSETENMPVTQTPEPARIQPVAVTAKKAPSDLKITNGTSLQLDTTALAASPPAFLGDKDISVLIVHTHTTESYTPSPGYEYTPSDTDRTQDKNFNMVRIGKAVKNILSEKGITVYHDTTVNDYPSYNGSYNKSAANVKNYLANYPSIKIVLDIHRDAIGSSDTQKTKYVCNVNGKTAACIMLVAGSNQSGLAHDNWKENLSFALLLQNHLSGMYPDLCRPLNFRKQRFNQQLAPGAIIVEVGTNGNTLDEAIYGSELFARGLADFLKSF